MPLSGPPHPESEGSEQLRWAVVRKLVLSQREGRREVGAVPGPSLNSSRLPGSGSIVNHYYCMQISMQIPQGSGTPGK